MRSGLRALILVSRQFGVNVGANDIPEHYDIDDRELSLQELATLAAQFGLRARPGKVSEQQLAKLISKKQQLLQLQNGRYLIALRYSTEEDGTRTLLAIDPAKSDSRAHKVDFEEVAKSWRGDILLLKKKLAFVDEEREFSGGWLIGELVRNKTVLAQVIVVGLLVNLLALVPAVFIMIVLDKVVNYEAYSTLYVITCGVMFAYIINGFLGYIRTYILDFLGQKIDAKLSIKAFDTLLTLPMQRFNRDSSILERMPQQVGQIKIAISQKILPTLLDGVSLFVFIPILYFYSPLLFFIVLGFSLAGALTTVISGNRHKQALMESGQLERKRQDLLSGVVNGIENVKGLALEPSLRAHWRETEAAYLLANEKTQQRAASQVNIQNTIQQLMTAAVIFVGVHLVFAGEVSAGILVAFNMLASRMSRPIIQLVTLGTEISRLKQAIQMVGSVINSTGEASSSGQKPQLTGGIELKNISFEYEENTPVLQNLDLSIEPRQIVGITGKSGCGKSTIAKLIQGLYRPQSGAVLLDNTDLRLMDLSHIRSQISLVGSESHFFQGTILENLRRPMPNAPIERVRWAAEKVGVHREIENMAQSYETILEENAANLATGTRQKLAIARALMRNPRILILDDAFTGFDVESEIHLLETLQDISVGRTILLIATRLWHLQLANKIFVVEEGKVTQSGTMENLREETGFFRATYEAQQQVMFSKHVKPGIGDQVKDSAENA
mgnify:CR=1 FL=1